MLENDSNINEIISSKKTLPDNDFTLTTLNSILASPKEEKKLMTIYEKLGIDDPEVSLKIRLNESMNIDIIIYNIKDILIMLILLLSSCINYNYLYIPFLLVPILTKNSILKMKERDRNKKLYIEIGLLIYSFLLIIFKIVCLILINKDNEFIFSNKNIFIDLGVSYIYDKNKKIYLFGTFLGEGLVFIFNIAAIIIENVVSIDDEEVDNRYFFKLTYEKLFGIMRKYLTVCYFILGGVATFNKSILSLIYIIPLFFLLFLHVIDFDKKKLYRLIRIIVRIILYLLIIQILIINFSNSFTILNKYFLDYENYNNDLLNIWEQFGFYFSYYNPEDKSSNIFINIISYFFICLSIVTFNLCLNAISLHELRIAKPGEDNEKKIKYAKNFFKKILLDLWHNPNIILHICRIMAIIWIYFFRNFYSLLIMVWLFFSFLYLHITTNSFWTKFVLIPSIFISLFSIHISRIKGVLDDYDEVKTAKYFHFALGKYDYDYLRYIFMIIFFFFANHFLYVLNNYYKDYIIIPQDDLKDSNDINNSQSNESDININLDNLGKDELNLEDKIKNIDDFEIKSNDDAKEEEYKMITIKNYLIKLFFCNINKITLISLYIVISNSINIFHFIFLFIFMLQIFFPKLIQYISMILIQIFNLCYLIEYIFDLSKAYNHENFSKNILKIKFFFPYDKNINETSVEILIYLIIYCFYAQYQFNNHQIYQDIVNNENINLSNLINIKLNKNKKIKKILFLIGSIISHLYIWILIILFIFSICYYEINLLFLAEFCIFFLSVYLISLFIQDDKNKTKVNKVAIIVLIYSGIYTLSVYFYQIICHEVINLGNKINIANNFVISNLPNIGFTKYDENILYTKLFPFFFNNFISILYLSEIERLLKFKKKSEINGLNSKNNDNFEQDVGVEEVLKEEESLSAAEKYHKNVGKMTNLELKNFLMNIILILTKFYWLFLFLIACILFTMNYLIFGIILYIIIFGCTFIFMFYKIISALNKFLKKDTFFISKVIRYSLIERKFHIEQNTKYRKIGFKISFFISCLYFIIFYLSGVVYLFENGCNPKYWIGCDNHHYHIINEDNKNIKNIFISLSYLFGFYVKLEKSGIFSACIYNIILFSLIAFDIYVEKIEIYFNELSSENRKKYKKLAIENVKLKPFTLLGNTNFMANISASLISKMNNIVNNNKLDINNNINYEDLEKTEYKNLFEDIDNNINFNLPNKEINEGKKYIMQILEALKKVSSSHSEVKLSEGNNKNLIIKWIKGVYEEIINFLLICTAISKLNIWAFIYMIFSLYFILSQKSINKYFFLFCFLIAAIIFQNIIFVSNIKYETDPGKNESVLNIIKETLNIPWYTKYTDDKNGFFLGLGVNSIQINLMWMDYIEVIIIYIYLDYFSYSVYQSKYNKGKKRVDKISYYNLRMNKKIIKEVKKLNINQFKKHQKCMKIDFGIDLGNFDEFKNKILLTLPKNAVIELKEIKTIINNPEEDIYLDINEEKKKRFSMNKTYHNKKSPLLSMLRNSQKMAPKTNLISESNKTRDESNFLDTFKSIIYLSFHNIILIIIMLISMMISGLLSIFYIFYSLIFLTSSSAMYMGEPYYYPRTIRTVLRVAILLDIAIQTLYQTPYINPGSEMDTFYIFLKIIGFNKIINFEENSAEKFKISLKQMILVFAKALTYFFMSIQILIYSSRDFQEYYLTYLLTKDNHLRKISLMNVFRFNNERIEVMKRSLRLRQEMTTSMIKLQKNLLSWSKKLFSDEIDDIKEHIFKNKYPYESLNQKYVPESIIKEKIKEWIFGSKLMTFQLWLHKNASSYTYIEKEERDAYKKDVIQGRTTITSMLESLVEKYLNTIDLSQFTVDELNIIKKYFDGTYKKELKKLKKENNKKDIENEIKNDKFSELEKFISNELFIKYLKTTYIIKCIFIDIFSSCIQHFHWLCYITMLLNHIASNSIISLFYPFSIFLYALLEYPRPKKNYWNLCLIYTVIVIAIKFIVQLELFEKIFEDKKDINAQGEINNKYKIFFNDYLQHYKLGLIFQDSTSSTEFFNYVIYDALLIIILLINNYLLVSRGLWIKIENEIEDIYQAMERISSTKHLKFDSLEEIKSFNSVWIYDSKASNSKYNITGLFHKSNISALIIDKKRKQRPLMDNILSKRMNPMKPVNFHYYNENKRNYYQKLFPKIRNEKPGNVFYIWYTLALFLILIFILLYYNDMILDRTYNAISVNTTQFSSEMILFLIAHIIILIIDRIIYINQNRNNLNYDYIIYDKNTCEPISEKEFSNLKNQLSFIYDDEKRDKFYIPAEYIDSIQDKYNLVNIQIEEFNFPLLFKYILHILITIASHILIFFYFPMKGNYNIAKTFYCLEDEEFNDFLYNKKIIIFYLLYIIYLISSSLQIKYGFYDLKKKSLLKSGKGSINNAIYQAIKAIPFLYEIKLAIDWSCTSTCLDLFQWNKFENIYDIIYSTYCSMTSKNEQLIGQKIKKYMKIGLGGTLSFALILVLVIPLIIFSSLNPTNELNNLSGATLKIELSFLYKVGSFKNYTLFENSKPESIEDLFQINDKDWYENKFSESPETKNFPKNQIQKVEFFTESERNWGLTKPRILSLIQTLEYFIQNKTQDINQIYIVMDYTFIRLWPVESRKVSKRVDKLIFDINEEEQKLNKSFNIIKNITEVLTKCDNNTFATFEKMYTTPYHLTANADPDIILDENYDFTKDIILGFTGCKNDFDNDINYLESFFTLRKMKSGRGDGGVVFYIFSDQISTSTSSYSIITFYVTFILLIGTYAKNFFSGQPQKIILTEMPYAEDIINLCEGILISRYSFDYDNEEKLYYILIDLMRSPDYLKILTESSMEQFYRRNNLTIKEKNYNSE